MPQKSWSSGPSTLKPEYGTSVNANLRFIFSELNCINHSITDRNYILQKVNWNLIGLFKLPIIIFQMTILNKNKLGWALPSSPSASWYFAYAVASMLTTC